MILGWKDDTGTQQVTVMATLPGDADLSGSVTGADLSLLLSKYNMAGTSSAGDFNYDGSVAGADISLLLSMYNHTVLASVAGTAVPEPGTLALLACGLSGLAAFMLSQKRKRSNPLA